MTAPIALTLADIAAEIDAAHADAVRHADSAIEHARRAGALLHKVKSQLPLRDMGLPAASAVPWHIGRGCRVDAALAGGAE